MINTMLQIREHETAELSREALAPELGKWLWERHGSVVDVDFPTPKTGNKWRLTAGGWVGQIPTPDGGGIRLEPKVQLGNLFRMLEYAYRLKSIKFPDGLTDSNSLQEYFESLAHVLAKRILDRIRRGIYRKYVEDDEDLQFIRGRIDIASQARAPWKLATGVTSTITRVTSMTIRSWLGRCSGLLERALVGTMSCAMCDEPIGRLLRLLLWNLIPPRRVSAVSTTGSTRTMSRYMLYAGSSWSTAAPPMRSAKGSWCRSSWTWLACSSYSSRNGSTRTCPRRTRSRRRKQS